MNPNFFLNAMIAIQQLEKAFRENKPDEYLAKRPCFQMIYEELEMIDPQTYKQKSNTVLNS